MTSFLCHKKRHLSNVIAHIARLTFTNSGCSYEMSNMVNSVWADSRGRKFNTERDEKGTASEIHGKMTRLHQFYWLRSEETQMTNEDGRSSNSKHATISKQAPGLEGINRRGRDILC